MSKHETPMVLTYWQLVGGLLVEEFQIVPPSSVTSAPWVDGLILPSRERQRFRWPSVPPGFSIDGEEVIVVQAKKTRPGWRCPTAVEAVQRGLELLDPGPGDSAYENAKRLVLALRSADVPPGMSASQLRRPQIRQRVGRDHG